MASIFLNLSGQTSVNRTMLGLCEYYMYIKANN